MTEKRGPSVLEIDKLIAEISATFLALMSGLASLLISRIRWRSTAVLFLVGSSCFTLSLVLSLIRYMKADSSEDTWKGRRFSISFLLFAIVFSVIGLIGALYQSMLSPEATDPNEMWYIPAILALVIGFPVHRESGEIIETLRSRPR